MKKSMIEVAYQVLTNNDGAMPFVDLWKDVSQEMGFSQTQFEDNIAQFYTDLSLDGRFLNMSQNTWDLRSRHTYSESVMDTDSIAIDEDDENEEDSELIEDELDEVEKEMEEEEKKLTPEEEEEERQRVRERRIALARELLSKRFISVKDFRILDEKKGESSDEESDTEVANKQHSAVVDASDLLGYHKKRRDDIEVGEWGWSHT